MCLNSISFPLNSFTKPLKPWELDRSDVNIIVTSEVNRVSDGVEVIVNLTLLELETFYKVNNQ